MNKPLPLLLLLLLLPAAAPPLDARTRADVRCMAVVATLMSSKDPEIQQAGTIGFNYFLGRIDGRSPGLDLEAAIAGEAKSITEAEKQSLLQSCGALLSKRGAEVEAIGRRLTARGI